MTAKDSSSCRQMKISYFLEVDDLNGFSSSYEGLPRNLCCSKIPRTRVVL